MIRITWAKSEKGKPAHKRRLVLHVAGNVYHMSRREAESLLDGLRKRLEGEVSYQSMRGEGND